jgi:hypothetical protein
LLAFSIRKFTFSVSSTRAPSGDAIAIDHAPVAIALIAIIVIAFTHSSPHEPPRINRLPPSTTRRGSATICKPLLASIHVGARVAAAAATLSLVRVPDNTKPTSPAVAWKTSTPISSDNIITPTSYLFHVDPPPAPIAKPQKKKKKHNCRQHYSMTVTCPAHPPLFRVSSSPFEKSLCVHLLPPGIIIIISNQSMVSIYQFRLRGGEIATSMANADHDSVSQLLLFQIVGW